MGPVAHVPGQLTLLPTPVADNSRGLPSSGTDFQSLPNAVCALLPTPSARLGDGSSRGASHPDRRKGLQPKRSGELDEVAVHLLPRATQNWGMYEAAIRRCEQAWGREAPAPTEAGPKGGQRLAPTFVEFLMGLPAGHVTNPAIWVGKTPSAARNAQLKILGNGVVPQQAAAATRLWLGQELPVIDHPTPLVPTPNPFHMGNTETPEEWRARRLDVFQRTGTRHGLPLPVFALSVVEGDPLTPDRYMPDEE